MREGILSILGRGRSIELAWFHARQGLCTQGPEKFSVVRAEGLEKVADGVLFQAVVGG